MFSQGMRGRKLRGLHLQFPRTQRPRWAHRSCPGSQGLASIKGIIGSTETGAEHPHHGTQTWWGLFSHLFPLEIIIYKVLISPSTGGTDWCHLLCGEQWCSRRNGKCLLEVSAEIGWVQATGEAKTSSDRKTGPV